MSQESSYSVEAVASVALEDVAAELGVETPAPNVQAPVGARRVAALGEALSASLAELTKAIPVGENVRTLDAQPAFHDLLKVSALKRTLQMDPRFHLLGQVVQREGGHRVRKALDAVDRAQVALKAGDIRSLGAFKGELGEALDTLSSAARDAHRRLVASEQRVLAEVAAQSLQDLGYDFAVKERPDGLLVRGLRQDLSVAVRITRDVEVHMDTAGFEGQACAADIAKLEAAMAKHGVQLTIKQRIMHRRPEGGNLMRSCKEDTGWTFNPLSSTTRRRARRASAAKRHQHA